MSLKESVLKILNEHKGTLVSGGELAKALGVSRNSVWKMVNALKAEGYDITSHPKHGYTISSSANVFNACEVKKNLNNHHKLYFYDVASSSNDIAKAMAQNGEAEGSVVVVKSQTSGKGRMGRRFISSSENGLYFTMILRPRLPAGESLNLTVLGAVALSEAIEKTSGVQTQIKWVNDIYINGKKCAGILSEAQLNFESGMLDYLVIGMGINITPPQGGFDDEISNIATSIYENNAPCGYKSQLLAEIINTFFDYYQRIDDKSFIDAYRNKSNLIGKAVDVYQGDKVISGVAVDIDNDARLIVKVGDKIIPFNSGEARVREASKML
ncbi:MAG: biotin--[Clostridia bacterium]|nr:biotin--[acetyl-CoA-carboxylase] ligase [Clostridia bacterium]